MWDNNAVLEKKYIDGRIEGKAEGRAEGSLERAISIARNLKKNGMSADDILKNTGLKEGEY